MRLFQKKPIQLKVVRRTEQTIRLSDWRLDPTLCSVAAKVLADPNLKLMLSVLRNEHPLRTALPFGVSMDDRVILQARAEGYEMALNTLESLANCNLQPSAPEAVFESI